MSRVVVIGLDSLSPEILFHRFAKEMPNLQALRSHGRWGTLKTCHPPITIPAWAVMFTGMDPGSLGIYGIHHRTPGTYFEGYVPTPASLRYPPIWSQLSDQGSRVAVIGMPPAYPAPPVNGISSSDFLTPDEATDCVYPRTLRTELEAALGGPLLFDATFRQEDRDATLTGITKLTIQRWKLARVVYRRGPWDLFAVHDIGPDRVNHAFLKFFDPTHSGHVKESPFEERVESYYHTLDDQVGKLLDILEEDTWVLVASDHGSQAMEGCFAINDWLRSEGYLALKGSPREGSKLDSGNVDWKKTQLWGTGGYYSRISFNLKGREPEGTVEASDVPALTQELRYKLSMVTTPDGAPLQVDLIRPQEIYQSTLGDPPDLMAYFGDLKWRAAGTIGHDPLFLKENDTGPDDAVHSWDGVYVVSHPRLKERGPGPEQSIQDVAPTLLKVLGKQPPRHMQGIAIQDWELAPPQ